MASSDRPCDPNDAFCVLGFAMNSCSNASTDSRFVDDLWAKLTIGATIVFIAQFVICLLLFIFFVKTRELREDLTARFVLNLIAIELWQTLSLSWELSLWTPLTNSSKWGWCKAGHVLWLGAFTAEPWASMLLCADLLDKLTRPLNRLVTRRSAKFLIALSWIVPLVFVVIPAVGDENATLHFELNRSLWCVGCRHLIQLDHFNASGTMRIYYEIYYTVGVFLPTLLSFFFYVGIFRIAYREGKKALRRSTIARNYRYRAALTDSQRRRRETRDGGEANGRSTTIAQGGEGEGGSNDDGRRSMATTLDSRATLDSRTSATLSDRDRNRGRFRFFARKWCRFEFLKIRGFKTLMTILVSDIFLRAPLLLYVMVVQHIGVRHYKLEISFTLYCIGLFDGFANILLLANWVRMARRNAVRRRRTVIGMDMEASGRRRKRRGSISPPTTVTSSVFVE